MRLWLKKIFLFRLSISLHLKQPEYVFIRIINKHKHPPVYPYWVSFGFRISVDSDWYDYTTYFARSNVILIID